MSEQRDVFTVRVDDDGTVIFTTDDAAMPWNVGMTIARLPDGRFRAVGISLEPKRARLADAAITVDSLRRVPLRRMLAAAVTAAVGDPDEAVRRWRTTSPRDSDHFAAVAQVYREAAARGRALEGGPRGAIQRTWHVSQKTADRWIRAARDAGDLEQPQTGRGAAPQISQPTAGRDRKEGRQNDGENEA